MHSDYLPTANLETLKRRGDLLRDIRNFFDQRDFTEVETPILSHDIVVDRYLHPVWVEKHRVLGSAAEEERLFLQTSPEFHMKRLLAAGAKRIFQIARVFRSRERGERHNPEFTMLEWYRVGDDQEAGMGLLADFIFDILGGEPARRISYGELFEEYFHIDPHHASVGQLIEISERLGQHTSTEGHHADDKDEWLNILISAVEPKLGWDRPVIVYDWPASQSALAHVRPADQVAERFELFVNGVELANGYHELIDPEELRKRNQRVNRQRALDGAEPLPPESQLLCAMEEGLPPCSGVALGVDRLLMVALGLKRIDEAIAFPLDRA